MGVTPARWIIDKSIISRLGNDVVLDLVQPAIAAGLVAVSVVTELEVGYSARSTADYRSSRRDIIDRLLPIGLPSRAEQRSREVQAVLVDRGQHRSAGVADC